MNPTLEVYLKSLEADFNLFKESLRETSKDIINEGFSHFPVFIAHQIDIPLGEKILDKVELASNWSISATTLEDLMEKGVLPSILILPQSLPY